MDFFQKAQVLCLIQCPLNTGFTVQISPSNVNISVGNMMENSQLKELLSTFKRWACQFLPHVGCNISERCTYFTTVALIVGAMSVTDFTNLINVDVDDPHVLSK